MDIPLITHTCAILARLCYMNNSKFLQNYIEIFKIPELVHQLHKIKEIDVLNIFEPKMNNINIINKQINKITQKHYKDQNLNSSNVKYISISTSNYSSVYIVADKRLNTIFVAFRGTYSIKSAVSYLNLMSISPYKSCKSSNKGVLLGIFKIIGEIFYTITEAINFLSKSFLESTNFKLVTTGHSLGGGCSILFSYLIAKQNIKNHIVCVTFGAPRVMNKALTNVFNKFIENNRVIFRRYVENGDPIALLPFTTNSGNKSYYHPDDKNEKMDYVAFSCESNKKTHKANCNLYNKTRKKRPDIKYHGNYLGVSYKNAGENLTDTKKEIQRNYENNESTVCRITTGGNNEKFKAAFFELDELKNNQTNKQDYFTKKLIRLKHTFTKNYKEQDIYMNKNIFEKILEESTELDKKNLNPLVFDKLIEIDHLYKKPKLYCL
jgi:hypothetical protein